MVVGSSSSEELGQHKQELEIRDMITALTRRLAVLGKAHEPEEADHGVRIITLAGDNKGATMKAAGEELVDTGGALWADESALSVHANSNYQAVNNSMMLGGSCTAEDPGVHIVISDGTEEEDSDSSDDDKRRKKEKDKKKKKKGGSSKEVDGEESE